MCGNHREGGTQTLWKYSCTKALSNRRFTDQSAMEVGLHSVSVKTCLIEHLLMFLLEIQWIPRLVILESGTWVCWRRESFMMFCKCKCFIYLQSPTVHQLIQYWEMALCNPWVSDRVLKWGGRQSQDDGSRDRVPCPCILSKCKLYTVVTQRKQVRL